MTIDEVLAQDFRTLPELIRMHAAQRTQHIALRQDGRSLDYRAFDALADRIAASLQRDGVKPGQAIAICAATSMEYAAVFVGALRAGVAVAPLAPSSTAASIASMVEDAGAPLLFLDAAVAKALEPVRDRIAAQWIALDDAAAGKSFQKWLAAAGTVPAAVMAEPDAPFNLIYSSGTTGTPKGIEQSNLKRWPGRLIEYYGMTEGGGTCVLEATLHPHKLHTVGCPAPGHDIRLIDDQGRELPPGATGEIVGHSEGIMTGYHNQPAKTAQAEWVDSTGRRFIRTGDIGRFDEDGFLILMDRKKDMIISGGFNVYPSDLEAVLRGHADVAEAAVVGVPSERWGETPVAFVVAKRQDPHLSQTLLEWTNRQLGKTQRLAAIELVESLPRSAIGKVLKRELRDRYKPKAPALS